MDNNQQSVMPIMIETIMTQQEYAVGIDIGSTTVKMIVLNEQNEICYRNYQRHYANIRETVAMMLRDIRQQTGCNRCTISITGSGGLTLSGKLHLNFIQEVVAVTNAMRQVEPETDVIIELGGEDAKIIFLKNGLEQRMNGICAGGTGAFIDQMASLLQMDAEALNECAKTYKELYPIAARCGVFAKSDIQPLVNDGVSRSDLAASIFQAVVNQTISGLACGRKISGNVAFLGGPLYFLSELREAFIRTIQPKKVIVPENAHLIAAYGTALRSREGDSYVLEDVLERLKHLDGDFSAINCLPALFASNQEYEGFIERQSRYQLAVYPLEKYEGNVYLGIDAGSTTTKLALISEKGELLYTFYSSNKGELLAVIQEAFQEISRLLPEKAVIASSCATGYGESLMKHALKLDEGEVETIAHYYAARFFAPDVDCVLDIGGQDMKCIKIKNGYVDSIILNEACSSGCGSFLETFANSLGYTAEAFAELACKAEKPVDLGTRCTVFMNSNVKQAQKEGVTVENIAAGLAYSVIKNALFKVLKLTDTASLGNTVVVQGGTFYNNAVLRSMELLSGNQVIRPDIAGLMGAFGAALIAKERKRQQSGMLSINEILTLKYQTKTVRCPRCSNHCRLTVTEFSDGRTYTSGNRCEKGAETNYSMDFALDRKNMMKPPNLFQYKQKRLFQYKPLAKEEAARGTIGIPRVLNMYENYPFWAVFFRELGFRVVLSPFSSQQILQAGMDSIPSESECYPAKLAHGHIEWLIRNHVDTIFYPCVTYECKEDVHAQNQFNCPMVISYPENIKNNVENLEKQQIRYLNPFLSFADKEVLSKRLCEIMREEFGIEKKLVKHAAELAWRELQQYRLDIQNEGRNALQWMEERQCKGIVLAGRPYHIDPEINHGIPEMIQSYGFAVLSEDSIADKGRSDMRLRVTNQWTYHSRLYRAAEFVSHQKNLEYIQLNSFGCGLDAVTIDQVQEILAAAGKMYTLLKIDEVNNLGAARIRVRSLIAAMHMRNTKSANETGCSLNYERVQFTKKMKKEQYTILCTNMAPFHFPFLEAAMKSCGYRLVMMQNENQRAVDMGLKYVNNDACYPATIVTGQIIDAVQSGEYDTNHLAVAMVQTGGGCRASNYVGFIRKALHDAGYGYIPVISVNANGMEKNEGFYFTPELLVKCVQGIIYGDLLMRMVYRMRPYEIVNGSIQKLHQRWSSICMQQLSQKGLQHSMKAFYQNCQNMIQDFDRIAIHETLKKPRVGIVGEVLVKFMPMANNNLAELLEEQGAEVVMPDLMIFLEYCFSNSIFRARYLGGSKRTALLSKTGLYLLKRIQEPVFAMLKQSRHFEAPSAVFALQEKAKPVLQAGNQCGEGWFLAGEIIDLLEHNVKNIVCVQPFGCLPNHIVGKGIMKQIRRMHPQANMIAVDYDPGASRANQLNRIKLMLENAW